MKLHDFQPFFQILVPQSIWSDLPRCRPNDVNHSNVNPLLGRRIQVRAVVPLSHPPLPCWLFARASSFSLLNPSWALASLSPNDSHFLTPSSGWIGSDSPGFPSGSPRPPSPCWPSARTSPSALRIPNSAFACPSSFAL